MPTINPNVCPECGGRKKQEFDLCYDCSQKKRGASYGSRGSGGGGLPKELVFDSFYGKDGYLRREIFLEGSQQAAELFEREGVSQGSIRSLFQMLKSVEQRIRTEKKLPQGEVDENFMKFIGHVEYQTKREVLKTKTFRDFVVGHQEVVLGNTKEYVGFVQYLTCIMQRIKTK
jgi:hypothetical protein